VQEPDPAYRYAALLANLGQRVHAAREAVGMSPSELPATPNGGRHRRQEAQSLAGRTPCVGFAFAGATGGTRSGDNGRRDAEPR